MADSVDESTTSCPRCRTEIPATAVFCPHCGSSTIPVRAGTPVIPGYTILRTLGRGGAAVVYLARQESLNRHVAVKVLRRDVEDPTVWREFRREAHTIARLSTHPHVVTVHTAGRSAIGQPYLVTEYLDHGSLGDLIAAEGAMAPAAVAKVGVAVAEALAAAHSLGILHRDVKPGNVLLARDGRIKLGDFGIARLLVGQSMATTDRIAFTPEHVAPEILRNEPDGPWTDVYGLASTLATALAGGPPFGPRPGERIEAFLSRRVLAPPPALPPSIPSALAQPVTRALDPEPSRRPSLPELRQQLAAAATSLGGSTPLPPPILAPPQTTGDTTAPTPSALPETVRSGSHDTQAERWRHQADRFLVGAAALLGVLGLALVAVFLISSDDDGRTAGTTPAIASPPLGSSPATASAPTVPPATTVLQPVPTPTTTTPTTTVPTTTVPTTTAPTSTTAAATATTPTTVISTASPTAVPAQVFEPADVSLAPSDVASFVRSYYGAVALGNYEWSWSQLAPEFQRGKARSYEYYVDFWEQNDIEVGDIEVLDIDPERVVVDVELRWNGSTDAVTDRFEMRPGPDGQLLIVRQDTIRN